MYRAKGALLSTIETVVDENPLSFATSRMVTIRALCLREALFPGEVQGDIVRPAQRLNFKRTLADTTAESNTSVKRACHMEVFCLAPGRNFICRIGVANSRFPAASSRPISAGIPAQSGANISTWAGRSSARQA